MAVRKTSVPVSRNDSNDYDLLGLLAGKDVTVELRSEIRHRIKPGSGKEVDAFGEPDEVSTEEMPLVFMGVYGLSGGGRATPIYIFGEGEHGETLLKNSSTAGMNGDRDKAEIVRTTKLVSVKRFSERDFREPEVFKTDIENWFSQAPTLENIKAFRRKIASFRPAYPYIEIRLLEGMPYYMPDRPNPTPSIIREPKFVRYALKYLDRILG
jgi:hypothetical protein